MKKAFIGSFVLAILHSLLFYNQDLGISVALYTIPLIFFILDILDEKGKIKNRKPLLLSIPIILLSITYFIFNNSFFYVCNIIAMIILFIVMIILSVLEENRISQIIYQFFTILGKPFEKIEEVIEIIVNQFFTKEVEENEMKQDRYKNLKRVMLGIAITIPILIVIIILLSSADSIFAKQISSIANIIEKIFATVTIRELICRVALIIILTIYGTAFIYNIVQRNPEEELERQCRKISFDHIVANTMLTILNIIYLVFCYIQIVNIFMGYTSLSEYEYAEYARQGFFQLMAVSLINLVIILITTHNIREDTKAIRNYTKLMNVLLAIFTFIILISSFMRMHLYEQEFGYTFLRLMVYIVLITEVVLMIPTIAHIFDKKIKLVKPYFIIILTVYVLINYINIDRTIARKNIDRYFENQNKNIERKIDLKYLETLGIDGTIEMQRLLKTKDEMIQSEVYNYLYNQKDTVKNKNWQEFNINQYRLSKELEEITRRKR